MFKIKQVKFSKHPVLGDLTLDFCNMEGKAIDTIIIAGENGTGKSTVINELYTIFAQGPSENVTIALENGDDLIRLELSVINKSTWNTSAYDSEDHSIKFNIGELHAIFSDVDINFRSEQLSTVTSLELDQSKGSRRSTGSLPKQINQLLIDIQALDDSSLAYAAKKNPSLPTEQLTFEARMPRFTAAFKQMFEGLEYSHIENYSGHKRIIFSKNGDSIPIDSLSSGEKQIVYRGCFLLKDINALKGAFVFIDEPEISLHPRWQKKILDYYKNIFTDKDGKQTSQIFIVTHSPFIIHNSRRVNDKVIVLSRDPSGAIIVKDKPEYYRCDSIEAIQDAFSISNFNGDVSTVYLEGRTDEKYFMKALEVYHYVDLPFEFKWIGYLDDNGQEVNTGKDALSKAFHFMVAQKPKLKNICLFDCDTKRKDITNGNVFIRTISEYDNTCGMKKGIENALVLDGLDLSPYYSQKEKIGDYGEKSTISEFRKMDFCEYICSLGSSALEKIFVNLKKEIDSLLKLFSD